MLGGGCLQEGAQMLMIHTILHNVNDSRKRLDCGTNSYHNQEGTPLLKVLNSVCRSLEPCFDIVIVMH